MVSGTSGGKLYLGEDIGSPKEVFSKDYSLRDYLILPGKDIITSEYQGEVLFPPGNNISIG